jgi:pentatricopeptide repeat protein
MMAEQQQRPENEKISFRGKRRRRRRPTRFIKTCWMTLLVLSTTERARPMLLLLLLSRFHSSFHPVLSVDAFTPPRGVWSFRSCRTQDELVQQRYRQQDDSMKAGNKLALAAATPSKRQSPQNSASFDTRSRNRTTTLSSFSGSPDRQNTNPIANSTEAAQEKVTTNVSSVKNSRRTSSGMISSSIRAKLEETRFRQAAKQDGSPAAPPLTQAYCDYLLAECVAHDEWVLVLDVLDLMKQSNLRQVRSTYSACLQACFQTANAASAAEILSAMELAQIPPKMSDYALTILAMCRKNQTEKGWWRKALQLLQTVTLDYKNDDDDDLPLAAYDAILACMVEDRQWQEAIRLLRFMEQPSRTESAVAHNSKTRPALSTYRIAIECCVASNQAEQAVQVLQSCVERSGLTPTPYAFELVIGALSKKLQWRRAVQLLDLMEELGIPRTLQIYNFVLTSCAKAREAVQAKAILVRMRRRDGIAPNILSYNSVMSACASSSRWRDALAVLDQAHREPGVTPDVYTYTKYVP